MTSASPSPTRSLLSLRAGPSQHPYPSTGTLPPEGDEAAELYSTSTDDRGGVDIDKVALEAQRSERAARPWWRRASATW